jgi:hypothetical protein
MARVARALAMRAASSDTADREAFDAALDAAPRARAGQEGCGEASARSDDERRGLIRRKRAHQRLVRSPQAALIRDGPARHNIQLLTKSAGEIRC